MPGFDRSGPEGKGSRTGRAMGKCKPDGKEISDEEINVPARGRGRGRGLGRGFRNRMRNRGN